MARITVRTAADVPVVDAGGHYTATEVEAVLQEIGPQLGGGAASFTRFIATPTNGQTVFNLATAPTVGGLRLLTINGVDYQETVDFTVSGSTLTWTDAKFTLTTADRLMFWYT